MPAARDLPVSGPVECFNPELNNFIIFGLITTTMFDLGEIITFFVYLVFFLYLVFFVRLNRPIRKSVWFYGILFILLSLVLTLLEGFFLPDLLNILEHMSMTVAVILILVGVVKKEL